MQVRLRGVRCKAPERAFRKADSFPRLAGGRRLRAGCHEQSRSRPRSQREPRMKEWFSARELASALGRSLRRTYLLVKRDGWKGRNRKSAGGRPEIEFHISSLPEA